MTKLYRVVRKSTNSLQPGAGQTSWRREMLYCGPDRDAARIAFHAHDHEHRFSGFGNPCVEIQTEVIHDSKSDDPKDDRVEYLHIPATKG